MKTQKSPRCWMLVDDNEDLLSLTREAVAHLTGAVTKCFNSPQAALAAFEAAPEEFELVITDFEMPGMNGFELCRRILEKVPGMKVLLATGSGRISDETAAHEGFSGLLQKPFPLEALQMRLKAVGMTEGL